VVTNLQHDPIEVSARTHLHRGTCRRSLDGVLDQIRQRRPHGTRHHTNARQVLGHVELELGPLLNSLQGHLLHQGTEIALLGGCRITGAHGEERAQPTIDAADLGPRRGHEVVLTAAARGQLLHRQAECVEGIAESVGEPPREIAELGEVLSLAPELLLVLELG